MNGQACGPVADLASAADRLYGLDLGEFTAARKELAVSVRSAGGRDVARQIEGLRAPSIAAWAVNQLVRTRPDQAEALRATGQLLRTAQAGLDAASLRSLRPQRDLLLDTFISAATSVAAARGRRLSQAVQNEVRHTLVAALADERAQEAVLSGELVKAILYAGLGEVAPGDDPGPEGSSAAITRQEGAQTTAQRREREARERVASADRMLADASLAQAEAQRQVEAAQRRIVEFETLLASARAEHAALVAQATDATGEQARAAAALDQARADMASVGDPVPGDR